MKQQTLLLVLCALVVTTQAFAQSDTDWFSTDCADDIAAGAALGISEIPDEYAAYRQAYCKYVEIIAPNGKPINIFAQNEISNAQLLYARDLLTFYITNVPGSEHGSDKSEVANKMADNGATLTMRNGYDGKYRLRIRGVRGQPLYDEETIPVGTPEYLDDQGEFRCAAFEEIIHLVQDTGIGIDRPGYRAGGAPEFQKEIRAALNYAHVDNKLWGHGNERTARWIAELTEEGSLTQEYLAAIVDSYYGLWSANTTRKTGIGGYAAKSRQQIKEKDSLGYGVMQKFFNPHLTFPARVDSRYEGTFSLTFDPDTAYTHKTQYFLDATLTGDKDSNLTGNDQDNKLSGNSGQNILDGKAGNDTAVFSGPQNDYRIARANDLIQVKDSVAGRDGTVTLKNIEHLQFADGTSAASAVFN